MKLRCRHRGFTLAEMIVASSITGIILLGMTSAMMVAAHAAPGRTGLTELTLQAGRATDQLSADVAVATAFTVLGASSIEMQVPDRTGDGLADTIRYDWSGRSGATLNRTFRGGAAVAVANDVRQFTLAYVKTATKQPASYTESAETLIYSTDYGSVYGTYSVSNNCGVGVSFLPSWSAAVAYCRITRADFSLKSNSAATSSEVRATLRNGTTLYTVPATVLDYSKIYAPSLSYGWIEATFPQKIQIASGKAVAVSLMNLNNAGDFSASIRNGVAIPNSAICYTTDNGNTWTADVSRALPAYVYGIYGTKNADAYNYNLVQVACTLKCGNSSVTQVRSDIRVLNAPQVVGP